MWAARWNKSHMVWRSSIAEGRAWSLSLRAMSRQEHGLGNRPETLCRSVRNSGRFGNLKRLIFQGFGGAEGNRTPDLLNAISV